MTSCEFCHHYDPYSANIGLCRLLSLVSRSVLRTDPACLMFVSAYDLDSNRPPKENRHDELPQPTSAYSLAEGTLAPGDLHYPTHN